MSSHMEGAPVHDIKVFMTTLKDMLAARAKDPKSAEDDFILITSCFRIEHNLTHLVGELTLFQWSALKHYMRLFVNNPGLTKDQKEIIQTCIKGIDRIVTEVTSKRLPEKFPRSKQKKFVA